MSIKLEVGKTYLVSVNGQSPLENSEVEIIAYVSKGNYYIGMDLRGILGIYKPSGEFIHPITEFCSQPIHSLVPRKLSKTIEYKIYVPLFDNGRFGTTYTSREQALNSVGEKYHIEEFKTTRIIEVEY